MSFADDMRRICSASEDDTLPQRTMRFKYRRKWGPENSILEMMAGRRETSEVVIYLYRSNATAADKPIVSFFIDQHIEIESTAQRSLCTVFGWPEMARAVLVVVREDLAFYSVTPCDVPMFRNRFGKD